MTDFAQLGIVPTLHDVRAHESGNLERLEEELRQSRHPIALIVPALASDISSLEKILAELADADWLNSVLVGLDNADMCQYEHTVQRLSRNVKVLWTDSSEMLQLEAHLREHSLGPADRGKGRNVWYCLGATLAADHVQVIAIHDADINTYKRSLLARLIYPIARLDYSFAKGYYPRITNDNSMGGRVTRLLVTPLLRALRSELTTTENGKEADKDSDTYTADPLEYLRFLESFRYPLAGEKAFTAELAADLTIPGHWGMDIGVLSDVYRRCDPSNICQVAVARSYDHKHQDLSSDDPSKGLRRVSLDVTATILNDLNDLGISGLNMDAPDGGAGQIVVGLVDAYYREAKELLQHYANDAMFNDLNFDVATEAACIDAFAQSINDATRSCPSVVSSPSWRTVFDQLPDVKQQLTDIVSLG